MKTIAAYFRYDWQRNGVRHLALLALALTWIWIPFVLLGKEGRVGHLPNPKFIAMGFLLTGCQLAGLLLFVSTTLEIGRDGSPRAPRHFTHTLPLRRGMWAAGKLTSALVWLGVAPMIGVAISIGMVRVAADRVVWAMPVVIAEFALSCCVSLAFTMGVLCGRAARAGRSSLLAVLCGESMVRENGDYSRCGCSLCSMWPTSGVDAAVLVSCWHTRRFSCVTT
jgi:hypothetical protein